MDDRELKALEDPDEWDNDCVDMHPPSPSARAIVSVAFAGNDFDRVSEAARREGMKTSEFIRAAALERLDRSGLQASVSGIDGRAGS